MKTVAFLPVKGNSERIPSKNMALIDGKPLFLHTLEKLCSCDFLDEIYLDSESDEILNYAAHLPYKPLKRNANLATNKTDGHQMFYNEVSQVDADLYVQILCTSPFIKPSTIKKGIDTLLANPQYDSAVLVKKDKQYLWQNGQPLYDKNHVPNSVDLPDTIIETMGLYIVRRDCAHREKKRFGNSCFLLEASPIEAIDINFPEDIALAEIVQKGLRATEIAKFRTLAKAFNSSIFSDILDELKIGGIIKGLKPNLSTAKILGRANTLKIRKLQDGEDYRKIYTALDTYSKITDGEIILVENEIADYAYFGELNANLAVRSGAIAAIIGGVTRDATEVKSLGLPVFSAGYCCSDVRGRAAMDAHNIPITINGVNIAPGDLIFADINGIAVIPQKHEKIVLNKAINAISKEKSILNKIYSGVDGFSIYNEEGAF
ncbi:MAG: cytidyltransferase [Firmicutes bacterium]|nr:cytidyltransferase [Bacillota bacterium]